MLSCMNGGRGQSWVGVATSFSKSGSLTNVINLSIFAISDSRLRFFSCGVCDGVTVWQCDGVIV